jgi:hypothetical protein
VIPPFRLDTSGKGVLRNKDPHTKMARQPNRDRRQTNGWDVLWQTVNTAFTSGNGVVVIGGAISLGALWIVVKRLDPKDLKDLLIAVLGSWIILGWLLFFAGSIIYIVAYRSMKAGYEAEIDRQRKIIDRLLPSDKKDQLKLE